MNIYISIPVFLSVSLSIHMDPIYFLYEPFWVDLHFLDPPRALASEERVNYRENELHEGIKDVKEIYTQRL